MIRSPPNRILAINYQHAYNQSLRVSRYNLEEYSAVHGLGPRTGFNMLPKPPSPIFLTLSVGYFRVDHASQTPALFFLLRHLYCWSDAASASQEMYPRPDSCILRPYGGLGFGGLGLGLSALSVEGKEFLKHQILNSNLNPKPPNPKLKTLNPQILNPKP